ncbi:MAG: TerC family protein [Bacteroidetes bacterium]|nr:TerC family protein [Bacteroidota bacterium]
MDNSAFWIGFNLFILAMLAFDLGIVNRKEKAISFKESILWVAFWSSLALAFNGLVYYWFGPEKAFEFLTGYVIEWSLSVDNLFVFIVIFNFFKVPKQYQHRVLFWGILGALILRGTFIVVGVALFNKFEWMIYIFGGILVFTGLKMLFSNEEEDPKLDKNIFVRACKKILPVTEEYHGKDFFVKSKGRWLATPLFIVLVVVDFTDLVFAVDSIPAVLSISSDPFIVYSSNVFAILGLRSLFFALSGMMDLFRYLKYGLAIILSFVGVKMLISHYVHIPVEWALFVVVMILATSIMISLVKKEKV